MRQGFAARARVPAQFETGSGHQRADRQPLWADLRPTPRDNPRSRSKNPRSASTPGHPRDVGPVPSLERAQGSPCGMRPLEGAMDQLPALPGPRLRGRIRPLRGGMGRPPVLRRPRRRTGVAFLDQRSASASTATRKEVTCTRPSIDSWLSPRREGPGRRGPHASLGASRRRPP
jgi:hypothetical protein